MLNKRVKYTLLSIVLSFIIVSAVSGYIISLETEIQKERYRYIAKNESDFIVSTITNVTERANTLRTLVIDHDGKTDFFNNVADDIYNNVKLETGVSLKNVAIAPNGVVSKVYPLEGNEDLIGFDFMDLSQAGNYEAKLAYEKGETVLTNPFELVQGGVGMAGRSPVLIEDKDGEKLWGLVTVTMDYDDIIKVVHLDNLTSMGIDYKLSCFDNLGAERVLEEKGDSIDTPVKTSFKIRNLTWELSLAPTKGWIPSWMILAYILGIITIPTLVGILANFICVKLLDLKEEATFDNLTGFLNKKRGTERIAKLCQRRTGALIVMDVDNFKLVNDLHGHNMGDRVLKAFAEVVEDNTRETDTVSRIGGDEFLAFYDDLTEESAVASLTLRLNRQMKEKLVALLGEEFDIPIGISLGVVMVPEFGREFKELFEYADKSLNLVKQNGKHGYKVYYQENDSSILNCAEPEKKLERFIKMAEERNETEDAMLLGKDSFSLIYKYVKRYYRVHKGNAAFILFTLNSSDELDNLAFLEIVETFSLVLKKALKADDIVVHGCSNTFCVMLTECDDDAIDESINRIMIAWDNVDHDSNVTVSHIKRYIYNIN
ncbi:MAG: sensor domain-containing diguanylate cyclase [Lachnospiraceae bacterium]|nr:sensor domain-containing diguanylate cyclase [Lachnospiraceae bacterium]